MDFRIGTINLNDPEFLGGSNPGIAEERRSTDAGNIWDIHQPVAAGVETAAYPRDTEGHLANPKGSWDMGSTREGYRPLHMADPGLNLPANPALDRPAANMPFVEDNMIDAVYPAFQCNVEL